MNRVGSSSVGAGGGGGHVGGGGSDGSAASSGGAGREGSDGGGGGGGSKARGAEVTEAEIASLRRQMKAATQVGLLADLLVYSTSYTSRTLFLAFVQARVSR